MEGQTEQAHLLGGLDLGAEVEDGADISRLRARVVRKAPHQPALLLDHVPAAAVQHRLEHAHRLIEAQVRKHPRELEPVAGLRPLRRHASRVVRARV
jgi:hypothetical protein